MDVDVAVGEFLCCVNQSPVKTNDLCRPFACPIGLTFYCNRHVERNAGTAAMLTRG